VRAREEVCVVADDRVPGKEQVVYEADQTSEKHGPEAGNDSKAKAIRESCASGNGRRSSLSITLPAEPSLTNPPTPAAYQRWRGLSSGGGCSSSMTALYTVAGATIQLPKTSL